MMEDREDWSCEKGQQARKDEDTAVKTEENM